MSKYSELADALVITYPNAGATAPDVVTLIRAGAALRELEAERDRLRRLVQSAYREGFYRAQLPGIDWDDQPNQWEMSASCAALQEGE
jgi:hypothetical protein